MRTRRDEHRSRTTRALREAALDLFATQGYDETTTEQIADKADVAARTFFRYFPTKESVLHLREREWFESFTADFLSQPEELSDLGAMRASFISAAPGIARGRRYVLLYGRAVASSATLRGRVRDRQHDDIATVAGAIADRQGRGYPDEGCEILASVGLLTHRRALDRWLAGPAGGELGAAIMEEFVLLDQLFPDR